MSQIYRSESDALALSCGFQEMPYWSIAPADLEPLKSVKPMPGTVLPTITSLPQDGLPLAGNTQSIGGS